MKKIKNVMIIILLVNMAISLSSCLAPKRALVQYKNPEWAPRYDLGVRYYYFPDLELYYDLSGQDFVYLDKGQWLFSNNLPSMYANYNLNNAFTVSLKYKVYQPWMRHNFYMSHYPRYYYKTIYKGANGESIRGFNENSSRPIQRNSLEIARAIEAYPSRTASRTQQPPSYTRPPRDVEYLGKTIGRPVPVVNRMKEPETPK